MDRNELADIRSVLMGNNIVVQVDRGIETKIAMLQVYMSERCPNKQQISIIYQIGDN